jgi:competence protein ComEC
MLPCGMKFVNFSIIYFSGFLTLGIVCANGFSGSNFFILNLFAAGLLLLVISWFIARRQLFPNYFFGIIAYICFFGMGFLNYQMRLPEFQSNHYSHCYPEKDLFLFQLKILEVLKPDPYNNKYIASIEAINGSKTKGEILLNIQKDSLLKIFPIDLILLTSAKLENIPKPLNPHQFDYAHYMQSLGVYHEIVISKDNILKSTISSRSLRGRADQLRNYLLEKLRQTSIEKDERAIIQALILGQKKDISKELYLDFAAAGAVHILAVSGLHIGILFYLFSWLLKPIRLMREGAFMHSLMIVICLWGFAFITGLSPSVTRAVTMFTFFAFANSIHRETNTLNTLFLSYFVLLLINPLWLFHIGFQLSYAAVLSILLIHPKISKLYRARFYVDKSIWNVFTVSIAAQLGVIPLSLYYFHQFPGLFFITNIVVLPILGIIIGGGVLIVFLAAFNCLPEGLAISYNFLISSLNSFINWVARQKQFLFEDIHFSELKVLVCYSVLLALMWLWRDFTYKKMALTLVCFSLMTMVFIWDKYDTSENELVVFHKSRKSLLAYKHGERLILFRSDSNLTYRKNSPVKDYIIAKRIADYSEENMPMIFKYRNKTILILDGLSVYPRLNKNAVVVLTGNPKVNLKRLIDNLRPHLIVADGSNYTSYVSRWRKTCEKKKLPFHHTGSKGALIIE